MCKHLFRFPMEIKENYNPDGKTLTGVCKCGAKQKALGYRGIEPIIDAFNMGNPNGESQYSYIDKPMSMW